MGDIIWLASYPKSGNTWMRTFLHNLLMNRKEPADINELNKFCLGEDKAEFYNHFDPRPLSTLTEEEIAALRPKVHELLTQAFPDNVFVKTHSILGKSKEVDFITMELTAGAIYMLRNPLDVAISFAHHFGLTIDQSIENIGNESNATPTTDLNALQLWSSWSTNVKSWTRKPVSGLHVVRVQLFTWMRTFLHNLLMNRKEPVDINELNKFCLGEDKAEYYNHFDPRPLSTLTEEEVLALRPKVHELLTQAFPDNVFVKTHSILGESKEIPFITMELTAGAIYMLRNPLDVAISYAHHFGLTKAFRTNMKGTFWAWVTSSGSPLIPSPGTLGCGPFFTTC